MELKHPNVNNKGWSEILLIVPYGIETTMGERPSTSKSRLLIVPYGIETTLT